MKKHDKAILVAAKHIDAGIAKYGGIIDAHLQAVIDAAGLQYRTYRFNDGRILLVLPGNMAAFLYADEASLYQALSLN